jgi:hypothetical protein
MKLSACLLALTLFLLSCGGECPCEKESLIPAFVSYADDETDTLIVKRFEKGSNFTRLINSMEWTANNTFRNKMGDTTFLSHKDLTERLNDAADWQLTNPFDGKTYFISEMDIENTTSHCGGIFGMDRQVCTSPIISYKLNGALITIVRNPQVPASAALVIRK